MMRLTTYCVQMSSQAIKKLSKFSNYTPTPLSINVFLTFGESGSIRKSFMFLHKELPIRIAHILQEFSMLPESFGRISSVKSVVELYEQSFQELLHYEKETDDFAVHTDFTDLLGKIRKRHDNVVEMMAEGVLTLKKEQQGSLSDHLEAQLQYFLDRFYMNRISIRMLINQHVLLFGPELNVDRKCVGAVDPNCNVLVVLDDAYKSVQHLAQLHYGSCPRLDVQVRDTVGNGLVLPYVECHLYNILFELMKNSSRAVIHRSQIDGTKPEDMAPIVVLVCASKEDITIKISDLGGGIARSDRDLIFQYSYSTAKPSEVTTVRPTSPYPDVTTRHIIDAPVMAGFGYGLPLSRLYARYFQGDLQICPVEGYGTNAIVFLKRHASEANELLPIFNRTSVNRYLQPQTSVNADWSRPQNRPRSLLVTTTRHNLSPLLTS